MVKAFARKLFCLTFISAAVVVAQSVPLRKTIPEIAKSANGAIITIVTANDDKPIARGTGFLVRQDGVILTNYHVIATGNVAVVKFADGTISPVDGVLAIDKARDLAVLKIHGKTFPTLTLGNSDKIQVGEDVVAIGNPLGLELTVSNGILSGVRTVEKEGGKFLQVTAPISHGSSGGPLFNMAGDVIGITSMYFEGGENLNFAIPVNDAKRLLLNQSVALSSLPNEPEEAAPSKSSRPTGARAYYKQLYEAGGFSVETDAQSVFVCFHDDPSLLWFFTHRIWAFDEQHAKAAKTLTENLIKEKRGEVVDDTEPRQKMKSIEASSPDVYFIDEDIDAADYMFGTGAQAYLRSGGRVLIETPYYKGVNEGPSYYYRWTQPGHLWTDESYTLFRETLSFEPTTLRYIMRVIDGKTHLTSVMWSGTCEKIPPKRPN